VSSAVAPLPKYPILHIQEVIEEEPKGLVVPAGQAVHDMTELDPMSVLKDPSGHKVHESALEAVVVSALGLNVPAPHTVQGPPRFPW
jgi:hypothetical protein